jgi:hypothetical protein
LESRRFAGRLDPIAIGAVAVSLAFALAAAPPAAGSDSSADRYDLANGCYTLHSLEAGSYVVKSGDGYALGDRGAAEPFFFEPPELGRYLLYDRNREFLSDDLGAAPEPSAATEWVVEEQGDAFTVTSVTQDKPLAASVDGRLGLGGPGPAAAYEFVEADGCAAYPEVDLNAAGEPTTGSPAFGETSGLVDAHMHMMAFEFLGGAVHCGRPWHRYGAPYALRDCPDHYPNGGGAVLENALSGGSRPTHDPVGWPTFKSWPAHDSLTHEQSYYRWLERAWMGGLRVFVNLMVDNTALCKVYPLKADRPNPCNEMETVRLEIRRIYELQNYIDAQEGGPGEGWFRIVTNPHQARRVINDGKLAVVLGIEVSQLFDCNVQNGVPTCNREQIDRQLAEVHDAGIRQMELVNKFDNALSGVAGDGGAIGPVVNAANRSETGSFWQMQTCDPNSPEGAHDHAQLTNTGDVPAQDAIFGAGLGAFGVPPGAAPIYPEPPHCNQAGLTALGEYLLRQMIRRGMIFDPDHMSVLARNQALAFMRSKDYGGLVSSHSWSTPDSFPEIYEAGGFIAPYAGGSEGFVHAWQDTKPLRDPRYYFGFGYGADANGFGAQGGPRDPSLAPPVSYPFRSFDGSVELDRQRSGERVFDVNTDGVAHYGLYPDWIQDLRMLAGDAIVRDMGRGAEAYLQMWERATGVPGPDCRSTHARFTGGGLGELRLGDRPQDVLERAGQPERRTRVWRWCVDGRKNRDARVAAVFSPGGKVRLVATTARSHRALGVTVGDDVGELGRRAERSGGLHIGELGRSSVVFGERGGKVDFIAVADRKLADRKLQRYLKLAGV